MNASAITNREKPTSGSSRPRTRTSRRSWPTGPFREDLYYRFNVISLTIPPLRDRPEDIRPLAESLLSHFNRTNHKAFLGFEEDAAAQLTANAWPGNVRELRNAIERAVILGSGPSIRKQDIPMREASRKETPEIGDPVPLAVVEELHVRRVMAQAKSLQEAADILGIDQATLWRRRKTYGI